MRLALASVLISTSSKNRPWQIALALAFGIFCGSIAQSSVLLVLGLMVAFVLPLHMPVYLVSAVLGAFASSLIAPTLSSVGVWSLTAPGLVSIWARIDALPLVPWLGLHNSLIHGGAIIGFVLFLPVLVSAWMLARVMVPVRSLTRADVEESVANDAALQSAEFDLQPDESIDPLADDSFVEVSDFELRLLRDFDTQGGVDVSKRQSMEPRRDDAHEVAARGPTVTPATESAETAGAMMRLEELLSGCRVQPHWTQAADEGREDSSEADAPDPDASVRPSIVYRSESDLADSEAEWSDDSPRGNEAELGQTADSILARSNDIVELVDDLIASLDREDEALQIAGPRLAASNLDERRLEEQLAQRLEQRTEAESLSETKKLQAGGQSNQAAAGISDDAKEAETENASGSLLRFDQIDMSAAFSTPLYTPHAAEATQRKELSQEAEAGPGSKEPAELPEGDDETTEFRFAENAHDEALRNLLHHLKKSVDKVSD